MSYVLLCFGFVSKDWIFELSMKLHVDLRINRTKGHTRYYEYTIFNFLIMEQLSDVLHLE